MDDASQNSAGDTWHSTKTGLLYEYFFKRDNTGMGWDTAMLQGTKCDWRLYGAVTAGGKY